MCNGSPVYLIFTDVPEAQTTPSRTTLDYRSGSWHVVCAEPTNIIWRSLLDTRVGNLHKSKALETHHRRVLRTLRVSSLGDAGLVMVITRLPLFGMFITLRIASVGVM